MHFGIVPGLAPGNNSLFFQSSLLLPPTTSPKQPRHVASVSDGASLQSLTPTPKKMQKVKVSKKIKSSKNDQKQPKRQQHQQQHRPVGPPPPKTYQYGSYHRAKRCTPEICKLPDCRCGGIDVPGNKKLKCAFEKFTNLTIFYQPDSRHATLLSLFSLPLTTLSMI